MRSVAMLVELDPPCTREAVTNAMRFAFANEFQRGVQAFNRVDVTMTASLLSLRATSVRRLTSCRTLRARMSTRHMPT